MSEPITEAPPVEIKVSQVKPRSSQVRTRRQVNIRPAAGLLGNAAIIGPATLYAAAGATGLWAGGAAVVGGAVAGVARARKKARAASKQTASRTSTSTMGAKGAGLGAGSRGLGKGSLAGKKAIAGSGTGRAAAAGPRRGLGNAAARAAKAAQSAGRALTAPGRAVRTAGRSINGAGARRSAASNAAAARRRAQVGRALQGKKPRKIGGLLAGEIARSASAVRTAWRKSGADMRKKKADEAKKTATALRGGTARKVGKGLRGAAPAAAIKPDSAAPPIAPAYPALPLPGASITPATQGATMPSNSPMRQMLDLTEQMIKIAHKWDPVGDRVGMLEVIREFELYPKVIEGVSEATRIIHNKVEDPKTGLPLNPVVIGVVESVHRNQRTAVATCEDIAPLTRRLHRKQIEVLEETPDHANNDMWGYSVNRESI